MHLETDVEVLSSKKVGSAAVSSIYMEAQRKAYWSGGKMQPVQRSARAQQGEHAKHTKAWARAEALEGLSFAARPEQTSDKCSNDEDHGGQSETKLLDWPAARGERPAEGES